MNYSQISAILLFNNDDEMYAFINKLDNYPTLQKYKELLFDIDPQQLELIKDKDDYQIFIIEDVLNIDDSFFNIVDDIKEEDNIIIDDPKISIITCLYNTPPKLFQPCINSMIEQTFKEWECILYDDGSDKYLEENIKFIDSLHDNRFKIHYKEHNGKSNTLNMALEKSKGKYIAIWDSDDVFVPERLEYQFNCLVMTQAECISNCMIDANKYVWPTNREESQIITYSNVHYLPLHPCQMFNKDILNKVPFLFEQIYDSMEDSVFNHIMFFCGVKMYFDNKILGEYCISNENGAHYDNFKPYLKYCTENLRYKKFTNDENSAKITCILIVNNNWKYELEKTVLNIRLTSDNVNIIISTEQNIEIDKKLQTIFGCKILNNDNYIDAINNALNETRTEYVYVISNPLRFCVEHWDYKILRYMNYECQQNDILQSLMFDMECINDNYYLNERGRYDKKHIRYGEKLIQLTDYLSEEITEHHQINDYINGWYIPILNKELCFFCKKSTLENLLNDCKLKSSYLLNVYLSLKQYSNNLNIKIYNYITCSLQEKSLSYSDYNKIYNYITIVKTFFYETQIIYEHIINSKYKEYGQKLWNEIQINRSGNINLQNFYKNINCSQPWII